MKRVPGRTSHSLRVARLSQEGSRAKSECHMPRRDPLSVGSCSHGPYRHHPEVGKTNAVSIKKTWTPLRVLSALDKRGTGAVGHWTPVLTALDRNWGPSDDKNDQR